MILMIIEDLPELTTLLLHDECFCSAKEVELTGKFLWY